MKSQHAMLRRPATSLLAILAVGLISAGLTAHGAPMSVVDLGSTYTPAGANYTITAVQGIDASNPLGISGVSPQVLQNVEFAGSIGVGYVQSNGTVNQASGLNIYNNGTTAGIQSTGLNVKYNSAVTASSINVVTEDFDIKSGGAFGTAGKAEPQITLFGANGAVIGTASPTQILASNPTFSSTNDGTYSINLGSVLNALGQSSDTSISGYLLSAPNLTGTLQGPNTNDPYFLVSTTNGAPPPAVPETSAFLPLLLVLGVVIGGPAIRRRMLAA